MVGMFQNLWIRASSSSIMFHCIDASSKQIIALVKHQQSLSVPYIPLIGPPAGFPASSSNRLSSSRIFRL